MRSNRRTPVAARAIILTEADDPTIGLMAFVPVGMSDVSSRMIDSKIRAGYHAGKARAVASRYGELGG